MPRLISIAFLAASPRLPGLHSALASTFQVGRANGPLKGWRVKVRPLVVLFVSPPGWKSDGFDRAERDRAVFDVAREAVALQWGLDAGEQPNYIASWDEPEPEAAPVNTGPPDHVGKPFGQPEVVFPKTETQAVDPDRALDAAQAAVNDGDQSDVDGVPILPKRRKKAGPA